MGHGPSKHKEDPYPKPVLYNVENNNWDNVIKSHLPKPDGANDRDWGYAVNTKTNGDPAPGCEKDFTSKYKCSNNGPMKSISISKPADSKDADYTCLAEWEAAAFNTFYIYDTGECEVKNTYTGESLWKSGTNKVGIPIEERKAVNSTFGRNYLMAGESLFPGEFIGSPSGNCYIELADDGNGNHELRIVYTVGAVGPNGKQIPVAGKDNLYGKMGDIGNASLGSGSMAVYEINNFNGKPVNPANAGDTTYIDYNLNRKALSGLDNGMSKEYTYIGTFDQYGKYEIKKDVGLDEDGCRRACNANNDCYGFVFNPSNKSCRLKNKDMFPAHLNRKYNPASKMYVRGYNWKTNSSCSKNNSVIYQNAFDNMPVGSSMTEATSCDLRSAIAKQTALVAEKEKEVMRLASNVHQKASDLKGKNDKLANGIIDQLKNYQTAVKEVGTVNKKINKEQENYQHVVALYDSSELDMASSNYHYLALTGLAALGVIAAIKATK